MSRGARWAIVLSGIVAWAAVLAVLSSTLPFWVVAVAVVLPAVVMEAPIRRFLGLSPLGRPPSREPGRFTVTVTGWGETPELVLAAAREEGADARQLRTVREALEKGAPLIVRRNVSEAAARDVAGSLERAGAVVAIEEADD
ncbi:hypothetical protein [Demequina gelatinilytica]|uniref:hypothetical protein n=1 Tax=Demequina gelatinilytica TaxID=1638980 RepID=UPI00078394D9|nr:hypothetical protein [Demequina gelatinilytica]